MGPDEPGRLRIAMLGTGEVCQVLAPALVARGHSVVVGTRDPAATVERNESYQDFAARHPELTLTPFAAAAEGSDLVVNAISGPHCVATLAPLAGVLAGRVLMDVASPYDFAAADVVLDPVNTDSLGEQLQRALPGTRVVKTFNTLAATVMIMPRLGGEAHSVFVSGDDLEGKRLVAGLLRRQRRGPRASR